MFPEANQSSIDIFIFISLPIIHFKIAYYISYCFYFVYTGDISLPLFERILIFFQLFSIPSSVYSIVY